jgi:hypothetical protein
MCDDNSVSDEDILKLSGVVFLCLDPMLYS